MLCYFMSLVYCIYCSIYCGCSVTNSLWHTLGCIEILGLLQTTVSVPIIVYCDSNGAFFVPTLYVFLKNDLQLFCKASLFTTVVLSWQRLQ